MSLLLLLSLSLSLSLSPSLSLSLSLSLSPSLSVGTVVRSMTLALVVVFCVGGAFCRVSGAREADEDEDEDKRNDVEERDAAESNEVAIEREMRDGGGGVGATTQLHAKTDKTNDQMPNALETIKQKQMPNRQDPQTDPKRAAQKKKKKKKHART